jgi:putative Mg2+ transporter-C (MgtC) family protein
MIVAVTWEDIALRIAAAVIAGGLIGLDRGVRGRIAGLRTTILMCVAATAAMIEANLMLGVNGHTAESFTNMDALRFPLGILSGIGFIGAGAIVRRDKLVTGITTAATLWLITVVGLILGAGYFLLGSIVTGVAFVVLTLLKFVEPWLYREHRGDFSLRLDGTGPDDAEIRALLDKSGFTPVTFAVTVGEERLVRCRLRWYSSHGQDLPPSVVNEFANRAGVLSVSWEPEEAGHLQD